jgi:hypothetical protein
MKRLLVAAAFAALTFSAFALPSIDAVQAEVAKGHYAQAEEMMREVVVARPDSARARYVYAEILAHDKRFAMAAEEAAQARRLDPGLSFTQPEKFRAFMELLEREQGGGHSAGHTAPVSESVFRGAPAAPSSGGVPGWLWGVGAALLAIGLWRSLGTRPAAPVGVPTASVNSYASPYAAPAMAPATTAGSGLLGTGLAVAGGAAAGMLAERLLEGRHDTAPGVFDAPAATGWGSGLFEQPSSQDAAARALEERPIDMGTGDGWGGGEIDTGTPPSADGW